MDDPYIQYTAAEKWNRGMVSHVEFMRDVRETAYTQGKVIYDADADYGGWWFCCFPYVFVQENDVLPFSSTVMMWNMVCDAAKSRSLLKECRCGMKHTTSG